MDTLKEVSEMLSPNDQGHVSIDDVSKIHKH